MDIINVPELASYLRDTTVTLDSAGLIVELANDIVTDVIGDMATPPGRVRAITFEVAARAYRNPNGFSSEAIDDFTGRRPEATAAAGVYLTPAERSELAAMSASVASVYTLDLGTPWPSQPW